MDIFAFFNKEKFTRYENMSSFNNNYLIFYSMKSQFLIYSAFEKQF